MTNYKFNLPVLLPDDLDTLNRYKEYAESNDITLTDLLLFMINKNIDEWGDNICTCVSDID